MNPRDGSRPGFASRVRQAVARTGGRVARSVPLRRVVNGFLARRTNIIFYHGLWPSGAPQLSRFDGMRLELFCDDMRTLSRHFCFVGLDELLNHNERQGRGDRPLVAVCFDDGCDMIRTGAVDVLESFRIPATVFVVTSCVGNQHLMWMHKLRAVTVARGADWLVRAYNDLVAGAGIGPRIGSSGELTAATWCWPMARKEEYADTLYQAAGLPPVEHYLEQHRPYMTWDDLREWIDRGHEVGLHTRSHPFCDRLARSDLQDEIVAPADQLRHRLGLTRLPFAYPFGNRLPPDDEARIFREARLSCMLGVGGLNPRGTPPCHLDRVPAELGLDRSLFGRPLLEAVLPASWSGRRGGDRTPVVYWH